MLHVFCLCPHMRNIVGGALEQELEQGHRNGGSSSSKGGSSNAAKAPSAMFGVNPQQVVLLRELQELRLQECRLRGPDSLLQLAAATTSLTCLAFSTIGSSWFANDSRRTGVRFSSHAVKAVISEMLQQHQQLSVVQLPSIPLGHAAAQHLCQMAGLRDLHVDLASGLSASCLNDLPSSITRLEVYNYRWVPRVTDGSVTG